MGRGHPRAGHRALARRVAGRSSLGAKWASPLDWSATILAMARTEPPAQHTLDGIDLLPILAGKQPNVQRTLFWRRVKESIRKRVDPHRAVRDGKWKYIDKPDGTQYLYDLSVDAGESKQPCPRAARAGLEAERTARHVGKRLGEPRPTQ